MSNPQKAKGDRAERDAAALLTEATGWPVRRKLGAGRTDDEGDLEGIPGFCLEVKAFNDTLAGLRKGLADSVREQANSGLPFGAALIWRPRSPWFVAMTVEQFAAVVGAICDTGEEAA